MVVNIAPFLSIDLVVVNTRKSELASMEHKVHNLGKSFKLDQNRQVIFFDIYTKQLDWSLVSLTLKSGNEAVS